MDSSALRPGNLYMLGCAIQTDPVVVARTPAQHPDPRYPALVTHDYEATVQAMTPGEKQSLAERVKARWQGGSK